MSRQSLPRSILRELRHRRALRAAQAASIRLSHCRGVAPLRLVDGATDGKLVDGAHGRPDSKPVAFLRDAQHRLLDRFVTDPLGQEASFFGSLFQYSGSLTSGAMGMERALSRTVSGLKVVASMTTPQEASLEEEAALLPGRRPQVVIISVPHKRHQHRTFLGNESVDLNQKGHWTKKKGRHARAASSHRGNDASHL